jgi:phosphohistidine phosphatase
MTQLQILLINLDIIMPNVPTSGFVSLSLDADRWSKIQKRKTIKIVIPKDFK